MLSNDYKSKNLTTVLKSEIESIRRAPPTNHEAEQALLGAILSNNQAFEKIEDFLYPEDFSTKL